MIVLGITGIVAAVIFPAINGLMPDKTKIMYLKVYDELSDSVVNLASDSSLFPVCLNKGSESIGCNDHPLLNTSKPVNKKFNSTNYEGNKKLCRLLAFSLNTDSNSCSDSSYTFAASSFDSDFNSKKSFTTSNGMEWWIVPQINTAAGGTASYQTDIYVDVDSSKKSANCIYNSSSCKKPDRFNFMVSADGKVLPADPMGLMYINTRKSFLKNKNQKVEGAVAASLNSKIKTFQYEPCVETHDIPVTEEPSVQPPVQEPETESGSETPSIPSYQPEPEPEEIDPCSSRFQGGGFGPLYMQCLSAPYISPDHYVKFGSAIKNGDFTEFINEYWSKISKPASETVTIFIYIDNTWFSYRRRGVSDTHRKCFYRPGTGSSHICTIKDETTSVSSWSSPFATCTYSPGSTMCNMSVLYNPFQYLPSDIDNCEAYPSRAECTYDSMNFELSIADISPRYDSTNIYYSYDWGGYSGYPSTVYSWLTNGGSGTGEFVK